MKLDKNIAFLALLGGKNEFLTAHHQLFAKVGSPVLDAGIACLRGAASSFSHRADRHGAFFVWRGEVELHGVSHLRHAVKAAVPFCGVDRGIRKPARLCLGLLRIDVEVDFDGVLLDVDDLAFQSSAAYVVVADRVLPDACFGYELIGVNEKGMVDPRC